jgi:hypothetical protein
MRRSIKLSIPHRLLRIRALRLATSFDAGIADRFFGVTFLIKPDYTIRNIDDKEENAPTNSLFTPAWDASPAPKTVPIVSVCIGKIRHKTGGLTLVQVSDIPQ